MPVPKGTRFRYRALKSGEKQRLAIHKGKVIEVKGSKNQRAYTKRL